MLVIAVSECRGAALKRSRMVLDRCLERIGERTWRGRLTQEGLRSLRDGLSERASKNTAVAAHLVKGTKRFELLWIVGSAARFNEHGAVSTYGGEAYSKYLQTTRCRKPRHGFPQFVSSRAFGTMSAKEQLNSSPNWKGQPERPIPSDTRYCHRNSSSGSSA